MSEFDDKYYMSGGEGDDEDNDDLDVEIGDDNDSDNDDNDENNVNDEADDVNVEDDSELETEDEQGEDDVEEYENNVIIDNQNDNEYDDSSSDESDEDEIESSDDEYYSKVDDEFKVELMKSIHPEEFDDDYGTMRVLTEINRDSDNIIIDNKHKTLPILTKYEKARILGLRISQLNKGAKPFIVFDDESRKVIDTYLIAEKELREKRLPYIIMRPIPNGKKEYWSLRDLEIIDN